jgi:hypothetical protein
MPKSSTESPGSLRKIQIERRLLVRRLTRAQEMAIGSVSVVQRKCGKPNCHCAQGGGHSQTLFLFQGEDGRRRCKLVRQGDADRLLRAGDRYREFRATLRKLRALNKREEQILVTLMEQKAVHYE